MIPGSAGIDARIRLRSPLRRRGNARAGSRPGVPVPKPGKRGIPRGSRGRERTERAASLSSRPAGSEGAAYVSASPGAEAAGSPAPEALVSPASGRKS